jgi:transcriptional regulator with XRE-family HTH domain
MSTKYPKLLKTVGDRIRKRRLDIGLFQRQVAEKMGVDEETIFRWERNESRPAVRHIPAIVRFLGYNPFPEPESSCERLVLNRRLLGLTQETMARRLGVDEATLRKWEQGRAQPSRRSLAILRRFVGSGG